MSDLEADPDIMFQHNYYLRLMVVISIIIPTLVPWLCWGETFKASFFLCSVYRYVLSLHITWLINSAAHMYGMKPFDKYDCEIFSLPKDNWFALKIHFRNISPADSRLVGFLAFGEGFHNFHVNSAVINFQKTRITVLVYSTSFHGTTKRRNWELITSTSRQVFSTSWRGLDGRRN